MVELSLEPLLAEHGSARSDKPVYGLSEPLVTGVPWLVARPADLNVETPSGTALRSRRRWSASRCAGRALFLLEAGVQSGADVVPRDLGAS